MAVGISFMAIIALLVVGGLLIGGILMIVMSRGKGVAYPSCGACGYDLSGTIGSERRCPECGADFATAGILPPGGQRRPGMLAGGIVMLVLALGCIGFGVIMPLVGYRQATAARNAAVQQQVIAVQAASAAALRAEHAAQVLQRDQMKAERERIIAEGGDAESTARALAQLDEAIKAAEKQIAAIQEELDALADVTAETSPEPGVQVESSAASDSDE